MQGIGQLPDGSVVYSYTLMDGHRMYVTMGPAGKLTLREEGNTSLVVQELLPTPTGPVQAEEWLADVKQWGHSHDLEHHMFSTPADGRFDHDHAVHHDGKLTLSSGGIGGYMSAYLIGIFLVAIYARVLRLRRGQRGIDTVEVLGIGLWPLTIPIMLIQGTIKMISDGIYGIEERREERRVLAREAEIEQSRVLKEAGLE